MGSDANRTFDRIAVVITAHLVLTAIVVVLFGIPPKVGRALVLVNLTVWVVLILMEVRDLDVRGCSRRCEHENSGDRPRR